jgi:hypothetical protein
MRIRHEASQFWFFLTLWRRTSCGAKCAHRLKQSTSHQNLRGKAVIGHCTTIPPNSGTLLSKESMKWRNWLVAVALLIPAVVLPAPSSAASKLAVVTTRMPVAQQNASYRFRIYASGGTAPYKWSVDGLAGSGLTASQAGIISGVPRSVRSYKLSVTVEDSSRPQLKAHSTLLLTNYAQGLHGAMGQGLFGLHAHNPNSEWPTVSSQTNPFGVVRLWDTGTSWCDVERSEGTFDWNLLDQYMAVAQADGVHVVYEVAQTPGWASSDPTDTSCRSVEGSCDAPADWQTFDDFMTELVSRYTATGVQRDCPASDPQCHGVISTYELWNEPFNPAEWRPQQKKYHYDQKLTMQGFVQMTQDAKRIIKNIDPHALVSSPSGNSTFMAQYWATAGAITDFDQVAVHAYPMPSFPVPESMVFPTMKMRQLMASYHIASSLVNTEGSWGQYTPPTAEAQAAYTARFILLQVATQIREMMWYLWTGMAALWDKNLTPGGRGYGEVSTWLLGAKMDSSGCLTESGTFQPDIYKCYKLDGTYVVNLVRPNNYAGQAVWYVKTTSNGVDWTATSTYYVPHGFTEYRDLNGKVHRVVHSRVTIGASPILVETKSLPGNQL